MIDIDIYNNSAAILSRQTPRKIISWITVLILSLITFIIFSHFYSYNKYINYEAQYHLDSNYIEILIDEQYFPISKDSQIYIENKLYDYEIINISAPYIVNGKKYWSLNIKCDLDEKYIIDGNILKIRFIKIRTTLEKEIMKKIKKGMRI